MREQGDGDADDSFDKSASFFTASSELDVTTLSNQIGDDFAYIGGQRCGDCNHNGPQPLNLEVGGLPQLSRPTALLDNADFGDDGELREPETQHFESCTSAPEEPESCPRPGPNEEGSTQRPDPPSNQRPGMDPPQMSNTPLRGELRSEEQNSAEMPPARGTPSMGAERQEAARLVTGSSDGEEMATTLRYSTPAASSGYVQPHDHGTPLHDEVGFRTPIEQGRNSRDGDDGEHNALKDDFVFFFSQNMDMRVNEMAVLRDLAVLKQWAESADAVPHDVGARLEDMTGRLKEMGTSRSTLFGGLCEYYSCLGEDTLEELMAQAGASQQTQRHTQTPVLPAPFHTPEHRNVASALEQGRELTRAKQSVPPETPEPVYSPADEQDESDAKQSITSGTQGGSCSPAECPSLDKECDDDANEPQTMTGCKARMRVADVDSLCDLDQQSHKSNAESGRKADSPANEDLNFESNDLHGDAMEQCEEDRDEEGHEAIRLHLSRLGEQGQDLEPVVVSNKKELHAQCVKFLTKIVKDVSKHGEKIVSLDNQLVNLTRLFNARYQSEPFGKRKRTSLQPSELEEIYDRHLNSHIKRGPFSAEEDRAIVQSYSDGKHPKEIGKEVFVSMGLSPRDKMSMDNRVKHLQKKGLLRKPRKTEDECVQLVDLTMESDIDPGLAGNVLPHYIFGGAGPMHYPGFYVGQQQMSILENVGTFQMRKGQSGKGGKTSHSA